MSAEAQAVQGAPPAPSPLHLESLERVMKFPVIEAAYNQGAGVYERVKGSNSMFNWALSTAEATVQRALITATPFVQKLDKPIHLMDQTLSKGIQSLEVNVPMVTQEPQQIYESAKTAVSNAVQPTINRVSPILTSSQQLVEQTIAKGRQTIEASAPIVTQESQRIYESTKATVSNAVQPTLNKVCAAKTYGENTASSLKQLSWHKANEVLATQYGQMAVMGVDSTSALAERLLDYYFPATEEDENYGDAPISVNEDPVLHTVQTVGRLSNKAARRVYRNVSTQIKSIKPQDVKEYVASLIAVLQLTQYLQHINQKVQSMTTPAQNGSTTNGTTPAGPSKDEKNGTEMKDISNSS